MSMLFTKTFRKGQTARVVFVVSTLLFLLAFVCFATSAFPSSLIPTSFRDKREANQTKLLEKAFVPECPVYTWNTIHTDEVPHTLSDSSANWPENNLKMYHVAPIGAFLFEKFILVMVDSKNMSGHPVFCRYFDCLRREIPNQFESRIYPESVVYCPRRRGALFISVSGNVSEKPEYPISIENRFKQNPTSTTVEVQIAKSNKQN